MNLAEVVGYAGDGAVYCTEHMSEDEAESLGYQPIFASDEGWEEMKCDQDDPDMAETGNPKGMHTLGELAHDWANPNTLDTASDGDKDGEWSLWNDEPTPEARNKPIERLPSSTELQQAIGSNGFKVEMPELHSKEFELIMGASGFTSAQAHQMMQNGRGMLQVLEALLSFEMRSDEATSDLISFADNIAVNVLQVLGWDLE